MTRVYDLRAGAQMQILIADGVTESGAIEYLENVIRDLRVFSLSSGMPSSYPDGTFIED